MANLNNFVVCGNVVADVEVKDSLAGKKFGRMRIAANRARRNSDNTAVTDFYNAIIFDERQVEFAKKYFKKGTSVYVVGSVHDDVYTDKDGKKVYSKMIYVEQLGFANGESYESITIQGRLAKDPEIRYTQGEKPMAIARYSVAVGKAAKEGEPDADFFNVTSVGKAAENIEKYLKKGSSVLVSGELHNDEYTDKDGQKKRSVSVMSDRVVFGKKREEGAEPQSGAAAASTSGITEMEGGFMNIPDGLDDELPFH